MIPYSYITAHRKHVFWMEDYQIEQDLVLCRALLDIFKDPVLNENLLFRGGTALHKLYFNPPMRYSEDIDLVQIKPGPIGNIITRIRAILDPLLGKPKKDIGERSWTLIYRMESEGSPAVRMRLKVEINTREHIAYCGSCSRSFSIDSPWYTGQCDIHTFCIEELLATKMRALYQRNKGRDLFDLWAGLVIGKADTGLVVKTFHEYIRTEGTTITRKQFENNLQRKMTKSGFRSDIESLIAPGTRYDIDEAFEVVQARLIAMLD